MRDLPPLLALFDVADALRWAAVFLKWISAAALFASVLLLQSEALRRWLGVTVPGLRRKLPVITAVFFLSMLEQVANARKDIDTARADVKETRTDMAAARQKMEKTQELMVELQGEFKRQLEAPRPTKLFAVAEAVAEEIGTNSEKVLTIRQLALDMSNAWKQVKKWEARLGPRPIHYQLLILTEPEHFKGEAETLVKAHKGGPNQTIQGYPVEVLDWCVKGKKIAEKEIPEWLTALSNKKENRFTWEIRQYSEVPFVHGFRTNSEKEDFNYRIAFCRWRREAKGDDQYKEWDWGEESYFEARSPRQESQTMSWDYSQLFDGFFEHLWNATVTYRANPPPSP